MADKVEMPNIMIPPHEQSKPKAHPADAEIMKAAKEIDEGTWQPDPNPDDLERSRMLSKMSIALGMGYSGTAVGQRVKGGLSVEQLAEEIWRTQEYDLIGRHPRVVEALEKMRHEVYDAPDPHAALEHNFALRELTEQSAKPQKWDGQGRWEGHDNEEMRYGQILTPMEFYDRLGKVVGKGRIKLGEQMVRTSLEAKSGRIGIYMRNPEWKGEKPLVDDRFDQIIRLRQAGLRELTRSRTLRKLGLHAEADKHVALAGDMAEEAMRLRMEVSVEYKTPELLRVGTLQWPAGTEWMIMAFTEFGAVWQAKFLGWRTALLTMIRSKAITEKEAHKAFPVPSGPAAAWYLEQLQILRDAEGTVH
jgi:hypothetical protein